MLASVNGVRPLAEIATTASPAESPRSRSVQAAALGVILGALDRAQERRVAAGDDRLHAVRREPERRRDLGGVERADAAARARPDVEPAPASGERGDQHLDRLARRAADTRPTASQARRSSAWIAREDLVARCGDRGRASRRERLGG